MYKLLLCWRYLCTRYIALVSIVSVMLGVATLIVVNSVMEGFAIEMQDRLHGSISDIVVESLDYTGMRDPQYQMDQIRKVAGDDIEGMTPIVVTLGMVTISRGGWSMSQPVQVVGIDENSQGKVTDFCKYLQHPENRRKLSFDLRRGGYDTTDQVGGKAVDRSSMATAGWKHRELLAKEMQFQEDFNRSNTGSGTSPIQQQSYLDGGTTASPIGATAEPEGDPNAYLPPPAVNAPKEDIFKQHADITGTQTKTFDMAKEQYPGAVLDISLASRRVLKDAQNPNGGCEDRFCALPGDDIRLTIPTVGTPPKASNATFTVVDLFDGKMNENNSGFVFVPIRKLQQIRGMIDLSSNEERINQILIKLKPGVDDEVVRDKLKSILPETLYNVGTWRDRKSPLLAAVQMETALLNVLLFMIIAVAGFGILAIFYMIVVEKTRDIGILKSLGASSRGIMGIFLSYGLLLGLVGSGVGLLLGLLFVWNINEIADFLSWVRGRPVFDPTIYFFNQIPTCIVPLTVAWVVLGAVSIAVAASILPARHAARLHPVEALRYE